MTMTRFSANVCLVLCAKLKAEGKKPTRDEINAFGGKHWREPNRSTITRMSDKRYHYMGCGRTYYLMGEAMGKAMVEMLK